MVFRRLIAERRWPVHQQPLTVACRWFASGGAGGGGDKAAVKVFDRIAKRRQRDKAAAGDSDGDYDYLREHIANALVDRIEV